MKRYKAKSTKGKGTGGTVRSFQGSYPSPIPAPAISFQTGASSNFQESCPSGIDHTGDAKFPQKQVVTKHAKCLSARETHQRLNAQGTDWIPVTKTPSVQHVPTSQTSRRKAGRHSA